MLNKQAIQDYLEEIKNLSPLDQYRHVFENEPLCIDLDERPDHPIGKDNIGLFFSQYHQRCMFLSRIIGVQADKEIDNMIDFINGITDEVNIYHQSISPQKTINDVSFGRFHVVQLDDKDYQDWLVTHGLEHPLKTKNFEIGFRSLLISKEVAKRKTSNNYNHWYDRLDDIYSDHTIVRFFMNFYEGDIQAAPSAWSVDNFPNGSSSGSPSMFQSEIGDLDRIDISKIEDALNFLSNKLIYRLIIRNEITCEHVFQRTIFLRSVVDPILEKNDAVIMRAWGQVGKKTDVQARYILKTLKDNNARHQGLVSEGLLGKFLRTRNAITHPKPNDSIEELHILYDKMADLRRVVYDFLLTSIDVGKTSNLPEFELPTQL
ncbi:MAG: hypothetical protein AAGA64_07095 [Bacteroidota bacterium]